jgi:hypothetical protein
MKDEMKAKLVAAIGGSAPSRWAARRLAEVDPHGRFVRWLANKQTVED